MLGLLQRIGAENRLQVVQRGGEIVVDHQVVVLDVVAHLADGFAHAPVDDLVAVLATVGQALAQGLKDELIAAQGTIINVTSIAGTRVHPFAGSAYATSKAALASLTRELAADFGPHGVRVNAIAPGEIDTSILSPGTEQIVESAIPMRRLGSPAEVANTIFFLCSPAASYINGAEIHINGGQHI